MKSIIVLRLPTPLADRQLATEDLVVITTEDGEPLIAEGIA